MPYTLPPITLFEGQTSPIRIPGSLSTVTWVKIVNASPYLVELTNLLGGSDYMQPGEANTWDVTGLANDIQATPSQFGVSPLIIPSTVLVVTWYTVGEQPQGQYPVNFNTITYLGANVLSSDPSITFERDLFTPFVLSGLTATIDGVVPNQLDIATGIAFLRQSNSALQRASLAPATFLTSVHSTTYYLDLNPDSSWSWGTSHSTQSNYMTIAQATTDGSGNISAVADNRPLNTTMMSGFGGQMLIPWIMNFQQAAFFSYPASPNDFGQINMASSGFMDVAITTASDNPCVLFIFEVGVGLVLPFAIGTPGLEPVLSWVDATGVLHAAAPVRLAAGNQETGQWSMLGSATAGSQFFGGPGNFKTTLTNSPTSISFTADGTFGPVNNGGVHVDGQHNTGFFAWVESTGSGLVRWYGTYATVGNCLLAVDTAAGTVDHHCGACGAVSRGLPLAALNCVNDAAHRALSVDCACGTRECFNTGLAAADEADTTPQGSGQFATTRGAQATLIRALMTALQIPLVDAAPAVGVVGELG